MGSTLNNHQQYRLVVGFLNIFFLNISLKYSLLDGVCQMDVLDRPNCKKQLMVNNRLIQIDIGIAITIAQFSANSDLYN